MDSLEYNRGIHVDFFMGECNRTLRFSSTTGVSEKRTPVAPENLKSNNNMKYHKSFENVPEWALCYLVNGDRTGLTDDELKMIDQWREKNTFEVVSPAGADPGPFFSYSPSFGLPCDCVLCACLYKYHRSMKSYKEEFLAWVEKEKVHLVDSVPGLGFKKGDMVIFTNDGGFMYGPYEVLGIDEKPTHYGGQVYIDHDSFWFPEQPETLSLANV